MTGRLVCTLLATVCLATAQDRYRIETIAGMPAPDGVAATSTFLSSPQGLAADASGNLYVGNVNSWKVKKIDAGTTIVHTFAGTGVAGYTGDGTLATSARINAPRYVALNAVGDVFISDWTDCVIRRIDHTTKKIGTYAGNGTCGFGGDNGPATSAELNAQRGIALDSFGNLYIADVTNQRVRRVDAAAPHNITTVAGADPATNPPYGDGGLATSASLKAPFGVAFDSLGDLYIADKNHCTIRRVDNTTKNIGTYAGQAGQCDYAGDGGLATGAKLTNNTRAIAFDASDNLYLSDGVSRRIRRVDRASGNINAYAGSGGYGFDIGPKPALQAKFGAPEGLAVDRQSGTLYIADWNANAIAQVTPGSPPMLSLYAGSLGPEGPATAAFLNSPGGLAIRSNGDVLITEALTGRIRMVDSSGQISTIAGVGMVGPYQACSSPGGCFLSSPDGIAVDDATGTYYFADSFNCVIRQVDAANNMATIAGTGVCGFDSNDVPATSAMLAYPTGLALDPAATALFLSDSNNAMVRVVTLADGIIHGAAGSGNAGYNGDGIPAQTADLNYPWGLALSTDVAHPAFIFADASNNRVRRVPESTGLIDTIAGNGTAGYNGDGTATAKELSSPAGVWMNAAGDLFIADDGNSLVRCIRAGTSNMVTIAGSVSLGAGYSGDGGPALQARLNDPHGIAADAFGHVFVSDSAGDVVRKLTPQFRLTTAVSPAAGGTVTAGGYFDKAANVQITAKANPGYAFAGFSGTVISSANPITVAMTATQNVVANFTSLNPSIQGAVTAKSNGPGVNERDYTLQLTNVGAGAGTACQVASITPTPMTGTGSFTLLTTLPLVYGTLNPGDKLTNLVKATVSTTLLRFNLAVKGTCLNGLAKSVPFTTTISVFR